MSPAWARDERLARAAWSRLAEPGDASAGRLVARAGAVEALALALADRPPPWALLAETGDPQEQAAAARAARAAHGRWRSRRDGLDVVRVVAAHQRSGGRVVVPGDGEWPGDRLAALGEAAPHCLWLRGPLDLAGTCERAVAVVGARACTAYGEHVAAEITVGVGERGRAVVSGGAYGIDAAAHRAALATGTPTVAVLAGGPDRLYPSGNTLLLERVLDEGLLVTEMPPGSAPMRARFLQRNRLIAALPAAVVVVEAGRRSGAVSTARHAAAIGRPLGAVPGPVTAETSMGCHGLLRDAGAVCVTGPADVDELAGGLDAGPVPNAAPAVPARDHDGLDERDARVLDAVPLRSPRPAARIAPTAGLPAREVEGALARLMLRGLVERRMAAEGSLWRRTRPGAARR